MDKLIVLEPIWKLVRRSRTSYATCTPLSSLDRRTPFERLEGQAPDKSMIFHIKFWDPILYKRDESRGVK